MVEAGNAVEDAAKGGAEVEINNWLHLYSG
jgi:hypothetical protein